MTVTEYIHKKNAIIKEFTGKTLVPNDQIMECEQVPLSMDTDSTACPYCAIFVNRHKVCKGCPMFSDECCPTYYTIIDYIGGSLVEDPIIGRRLRKLIKEYNSELKYD